MSPVRIQECHGLVGVMVTALILGIHLLSHATWATVWKGHQRSFAWEGVGACGAHLCQGVWVRCQLFSFIFFLQYFLEMSRLNHMDVFNRILERFQIWPILHYMMGLKMYWAIFGSKLFKQTIKHLNINENIMSWHVSFNLTQFNYYLTFNKSNTAAVQIFPPHVFQLVWNKPRFSVIISNCYNVYWWKILHIVQPSSFLSFFEGCKFLGQSSLRYNSAATTIINVFFLLCPGLFSELAFPQISFYSLLIWFQFYQQKQESSFQWMLALNSKL